MQNAFSGSRADSEAGSNDNRHPVRDVVARLEAMTDHDRVALRHLLEAFGRTSFVPALLVPALLVVSPLSGIPFFSSVCGITIALIAAQMLWKRDHLWLPEFVTARQVPGHKLHAAIGPMRRIADFLDRHTHDNRLHYLVGRGGRLVPQSLCILAGVLMPMLELVPFSSSILGAAVLCFAVGFLTRDGLFVVFGIAIMAAAALVPILVLTG